MTAIAEVASPGVSHRIREIEADDRDDLRTVARLHVQLMDFGPMSALGEVFVREACYRIQMVDRTLRVALYEVAGRSAGFVAYTSQSISFHRRSLRNHFPYVMWLLGRSLVEQPRRLPKLARAVKVVRSRRGEVALGSDPMGEVVCLAVLPEYLTHAFVRTTGLHVSEELVRHAMGRLRDAGLSQMRMIVDADNKPTLFLYHRMGARFEPYEQGGRPVVHVWFDLAESTG